MKANVSKFNDAQFSIVELEERLEMTAAPVDDGDITVKGEVGVDKNGPSAKATVSWTF